MPDRLKGLFVVYRGLNGHEYYGVKTPNDVRALYYKGCRMEIHERPSPGCELILRINYPSWDEPYPGPKKRYMAIYRGRPTIWDSDKKRVRPKTMC